MKSPPLNIEVASPGHRAGNLLSRRAFPVVSYVFIVSHFSLSESLGESLGASPRMWESLVRGASHSGPLLVILCLCTWERLEVYGERRIVVASREPVAPSRIPYWQLSGEVLGPGDSSLGRKGQSQPPSNALLTLHVRFPSEVWSDLTTF
jgi:hypothetical protein